MKSKDWRKQRHFPYFLFSIFVRIVNIYTLLFLIIIIYTFYNIDKKLFKKIVYKVIYKNKKNFIDKNTPSFFFIQRIRDESHRYAIGAHKAKRKREMHASELEPIEGLGRSRRKLLLNHFGSVKNIKNASAQDMMKVRGISKLLSEKIYAYFNG